MVIQSSFVHEHFSQMRVDGLLQSDQNVFHLFSGDGVAAGVRLAKATNIVVVLALYRETSERQGTLKVLDEFVREDQLLGRLLLFFEALYELRCVTIRSKDYKT
jgi:hypothetical protein